MARVTRSKKIDISEDQTASPVSSDQFPDFLPQTKHLVDIPNTNTMAAMQDPLAAELKGLKAAYRTAIGGGRKGPKRGKKQKKNKMDSSVEGSEGLQEETDGVNAKSEANSLPDAAHTVLKSREDEQQRFEVPLEQSSAPERRTTRRQAAKAQAAEQALSQSSIGDSRGLGNAIGKNEAAETPSASQVLADGHITLKEDMVAKERVAAESMNSKECISAHPSPTKSPVKTLDDVERSLPLDKLETVLDDADDSFVEQIIARSPAKPVSRIEDSVEALDQLEEALEALDEAALAERMVSPEKTRQRPQREFTKPLDAIALWEKKQSQREIQEKPARLQSTRSQSAKPGYSSVRVKPTAPKASVIKKATSMVFRSQTPSEASTKEKPQVQPKPKTTASKRPMSMFVKSTDSAEKPQLETVSKAPSRRPISLLPPRDTVKSSKPVTKAAFELPGEAIAKKLRELREARLARKEASEESAPTARAVSGPQVKSTKPLTVSNFELPGEALSRRKREAHEARLKAQEEEERKRREFKAKPLRKSVVPNVAPRETVASRARHSRIGLENVTESSPTKRNSVVSNVGAHRPSLAQANTANISAPRAPGPTPALSRKPSTTSASGISMSGRAMQRTVSATEVQVQRQRAKELYNRDAKLTEEIERERREREAAAKRAREEAAERGRQASREWAEKQLARKMAESDKGMSVGYGPGGQMGLKA